jgi:hypothetical protein
MLAAFAFALLPGRAPAQSAGGGEPAAQLFAAGDFAAAAAAYERALTSNPRDADAQLGLGRIRLYENDLANAEPLLRAAANADPANRGAAALLEELQRRHAEAAKPVSLAGASTDVPFVTADPLPVVHATIDGKSGAFVIDTGGTVDLEPAFAQALGLKVTSHAVGTFAGGKQAAVGSSSAASIALGGASTSDVVVDVLPLGLSKMFGMPIDGVIGTTLFERFLVTIDYPHARLVIRKRGAEQSQAFIDAARDAYATIVPCWLVGDHYVFARASVNDAPSGLFLFDSGLAGGGLLPSPALISAAKLQIDLAKTSTGQGGGGATAVVPFVAGTIAVDDAEQQNVPGIYTPEGTPFAAFPFTAWGLISDLYLRHYAYTVDFDAMRLVLSPA